MITEFTLLATLPWWRAFRMALAVACLFHLGVLLVFNIAFGVNIAVYGAFVTWGAWIGLTRVWLLAPPVAAVAGLVVSGLTVSVVLTFIGAAAGIAYLAAQARLAVKTDWIKGFHQKDPALDG